MHNLPANPVRILVIDDDEDDFFIINEYIRGIQGYQQFVIDWCPQYKKALEEICKDNYHIYFVDYRLGIKTGLDFIRESIENHCEEPFILLTGKGNHEIDIKAMEAGAVDYLIKSEMNTEKLERCIRYALGRHIILRALKANEQKFRNIFEKSKDAVFISDEKLVFKDVNEAACELFLFTKNELMHMSLFDLLADTAYYPSIIKQLDEKGEAVDIEVEIISKSKERIIGILSISKHTDIAGAIFMHGIIHDITNLKRSEKATLVAEKLKATGRLVQTLAHEVRNPLNNITLAVEQLIPEINNDEAKIFLEIIGRNSNRIGSLITELLDSSRPTETPLEKVQLQSILEQSIEASMDRMKLNRINLITNYYSEAYIMADATKLKIAFLNIIINAIEAMQADNGILSLSMFEDESSHKVLITDNGKGISDDNISRLFEPYFTSKRNGMGLGLASTLNIIHSHNARVDVESKLDIGTTFTIAFKKA